MPEKKSRRFFILTASIGTGHSQAARAIAESIKEMHPEDSVRVLDFVSRDVLSVDQIIKRTYLQMIRLIPDIYDSLYSNSQKSSFGKTSQVLLSLSFRRRMKRLIRVLNPDALIFTHPFPAGAADLLKKKGDITTPLLGVITDFDIHQLWIDRHLDGYCVATPELASLLSRYGISSDIIHTTGIPVRKSFYEESARRPDPEKGTVLVMGGGLGLGRIADDLKRMDEVDEISRFIVITGQNISLYEEVAALAERLRHPVELHSYTNKVARIMGRCELLVTKPGALTCTEAIVMNKPMVLVNTLPGQERANAAFLSGLGCAEWVKRGELAETVRYILANPEKRKQMENACGTSHVESAGEVVKILYDMVEKMDKKNI
ncbi:MGDG synthase family glycosyltransferase [Dialister invisus]|jgi:processive 1,2-diacylglycerol beta-glucosyltransferase|uniref:MGDG synthase family glycosyltransferase n=1 Tax=Dialister invisus TaxID=218538 RepID=UPI003AF61212